MLNWLSLACKRKLHKCSLVFKCLNNLVPKYLTEYFIRNKAFHDYGTRRSNDLRPFHLLNWLSLACKRKLHKCNLVFKCLNNLVPKYLTEYFIRNKAFHDYGTRRSNDLRPFHLLNWLSLACKRKLHKCNLVFKCLNNLVPKYLTEYFIRNKAFHDYGTRRSNDLRPFHLLNWLSLACKRKLHKCNLVFKCLNNLVPKYLTEYFIRNKAFHDYGTRRSNDLHPPKPMTNMGKRTFKYAGTIHSNFLPAHIKTALSFSNFKSLLIKHYS